MQVSDWLKTGDFHRKHATVIRGPFDGDKARFHHELMRKATPDEARDIRILVQATRTCSRAHLPPPPPLVFCAAPTH